MTEDGKFFVREHLARIDREMVEMQALREQAREQQAPPAWLLLLGMVLALGLASPVTIAVLDRVWPVAEGDR